MKTLIPWRRPTAFVEPLRSEMENLFERFFGPTNGETAVTTWAPNVDVEETDKEIFVRADLPGVDAKDIEISVFEDVLTMKGEKKEQKEEKGKNFHRMERFVGQFYRTIPLPPGADPEKITATTAKGVVTVTIPKKPGTLPKRVVVKPTE